MKNITTLFLLLFVFSLSAQIPGVGINSNGASPDPSSILDVSSTTQGVLLPRMSSTQMGQITSPATGLLVYQTGANSGYYYYDGTNWVSVSSNQSEPQAFASLSGTTYSLSPGDNFVFGTSDFNHSSGIETKFSFSDTKGAFRAGAVNSPNWDESNIGSYSFASGYNTKAGGKGSFAAGNEVTAPSYAEAVFGSYNLSYTPSSTTSFNSNDRIFSIGNGSSSSNRSNAMTVLKNGRVGLGTTSPSSNLEVADYGTQIISNGDDFIANIHGYHDHGLLVHTGYNDGVDIARFSRIGSGFVELPVLTVGDNGYVAMDKLISLNRTTGSSSANPHSILVEGTTGISQFINFRTGGSAPLGASGIILSKYSNSHFFLSNDGAFDIRFSNESNNNPDYNSGTASSVFRVKSTGVVNIPNLGGSGNQMVVADNNGDLVTQAIPATVWSRNSSAGSVSPTTTTDKVGIGTSSPDYILDVNGAARVGWNGYNDKILLSPFEFSHGANYTTEDGGVFGNYMKTTNGAGMWHAVFAPKGYEIYGLFLVFYNGPDDVKLRKTNYSTNGVTNLKSNWGTAHNSSGNVSYTLNAFDNNETVSGDEYLYMEFYNSGTNNVIFKGGYLMIRKI